MTKYICSLINNEPQEIAPGRYQIVRFSYAVEEETEDDFKMHENNYDPPVVDWSKDDRSGLIYPMFRGRALLTLAIHWEKGDYTELRDRFIRNPLGDKPNPTAYNHRPPSPGMQCFTSCYPVHVYINVPMALQVAHNDKVPRNITHAQFKMDIETNVG